MILDSSHTCGGNKFEGMGGALSGGRSCCGRPHINLQRDPLTISRFCSSSAAFSAEARAAYVTKPQCLLSSTRMDATCMPKQRFSMSTSFTPASIHLDCLETTQGWLSSKKESLDQGHWPCSISLQWPRCQPHHEANKKVIRWTRGAPECLDGPRASRALGLEGAPRRWRAPVLHNANPVCRHFILH